VQVIEAELQVLISGSEQAVHGRGGEITEHHHHSGNHQAEDSALGSGQGGFPAITPSESVADQGGGSGGKSAAGGKQDEQHREGEGQGGQSFGGVPTAIPGVHHIVHGVEKEPR